MSASSRPTLAPSAASASARLTAVVLLPTPPLPEATATMFLTLGSKCTPRCTAWATIFCVTLTETFSTPATPLAAAISARRKRRNLALGGVAEFDVERHVAASDLEVLQRLGGDEIFAGVGINNGLQGLQQLVRGGHSGFFHRNGGSAVEFSDNL